MSQKKQKKLSLKRQKFAQEYIKHFNGAQAAKDAGFSGKTAGSQAYTLLQHEDVQQYIEELLKEQQKRTQVDADKVVEEFAKIAFANMQDFYDSEGVIIPIQDLAPHKSAAIRKIKEKEYTLPDGVKRIDREFELNSKQAALESLGNHFRIFDKEKPIEPTDINVNVTIKRKKNKATKDGDK